MIIPIGCQYEITEGCNHSCTYCYNYFRDLPSVGNSEGCGIVERIADQNVFFVVMTGGEPFLVREKLFSSADVFEKNNIDFSINTNLTLVSREDLQKLKSKGLFSVLTSFISYDSEIHDGVTGVSGSHKRVMEGMGLTVGEEINLAANMVINRLNKDQVYETGKFLYESFGDISFCATPMIPSPGKPLDFLSVSSEEYVKGLDDLLRLNQDFGMRVDSLCPPLPCIFDDLSKYKLFLRRTCVGGRTTFTVSSDGQVRPCSHSDGKYGNILEESLELILGRMTSWRNDSLIPEECSDCAYELSCRGGCRVAAQAFSDSLKGVHPYFYKPVREGLEFEQEQLLFNLENSNLKIGEGRFRYREEEGGFRTVYLSPMAFMTMSESYFNLFKVLRAYDGKNIGEIREGIGMDFEFFSGAVGAFQKRGLMRVAK